MSEAPERIYMDPDIKFPECEKQYGCDVEYIRGDLVEAIVKKLGDSLVTAEAKLAKVTEALGNVVEEYDLFRKDEYERGLSPLDDEIHDARTTLTELKGEDRG